MARAPAAALVSRALCTAGKRSSAIHSVRPSVPRWGECTRRNVSGMASGCGSPNRQLNGRAGEALLDICPLLGHLPPGNHLREHFRGLQLRGRG